MVTLGKPRSHPHPLETDSLQDLEFLKYGYFICLWLAFLWCLLPASSPLMLSEYSLPSSQKPSDLGTSLVPLLHLRSRGTERLSNRSKVVESRWWSQGEAGRLALAPLTAAARPSQPDAPPSEGLLLWKVGEGKGDLHITKYNSTRWEGSGMGRKGGPKENEKSKREGETIKMEFASS